MAKTTVLKPTCQQTTELLTFKGCQRQKLSFKKVYLQSLSSLNGAYFSLTFVSPWVRNLMIVSYIFFFYVSANESFWNACQMPHIL